ncbi:uncharacterized protein CC84DRAFT_756782 [Paraphaeosphaeria sporulosa]|uniref:Uncharacterized protein n=1 Tax=Paraphaeosphaeria sporulosa TaxID=1460663 RepID=A0A177CF86_9PLEO|nr:uncharacterized protein CC84DRAFT_756782 [Paraphaeosphaeria sporulosa]OAG06283.1 hypothetical protein CC84DRAFT_756782 [Paraphaeosphaeria sporulosa]
MSLLLLFQKQEVIMSLGLGGRKDALPRPDESEYLHLSHLNLQESTSKCLLRWPLQNHVARSTCPSDLRSPNKENLSCMLALHVLHLLSKRGIDRKMSLPLPFQKLASPRGMSWGACVHASCAARAGASSPVPYSQKAIFAFDVSSWTFHELTTPGKLCCLRLATPYKTAKLDSPTRCGLPNPRAETSMCLSSGRTVSQRTLAQGIRASLSHLTTKTSATAIWTLKPSCPSPIPVSHPSCPTSR